MATDNRTSLIGSGIGSLAAAAFMILDGGMIGQNITIFETLDVAVGSLDGAGSAEIGYWLRGGWMLTTDNSECTWGLFKTIPSPADALTSVFQETVDFNDGIMAHSQARLIDANRAIVDATTMGFFMSDQIELLKLTEASQETLG